MKESTKLQPSQSIESPESARTENAILYRIAGPIAIAKGLNAKMYNVVLVGKDKLLGEVIQIHQDKTTIQVYEDTSGLRPGEPVEDTGKPLTVELGPGLLAGIYDGIQRPLPSLVQLMGDFINRGARIPALDVKKRWQFNPTVKNGTKVNGGAIIGYVEEVPGFKHHILVPPHISGIVTGLKIGEFTVEEPIGIVAREQGGMSQEYLRASSYSSTMPASDSPKNRQATAASSNVNIYLKQDWPVRVPRPVQKKHVPDVPLITGQRVMDTLFPIAKGGTAIISGPFGAGKTVNQHQFAKWSDADIIIYVGCGERGNEMTEVLVDFPELKDPRNGAPLMNRTVLIANTSNMPVAAREASIYTGVTIAEYFRDMGYDVALMADSTSRWAEALREISSRLEEMPGEEGYPAYLASRIAAFYERAGSCTPLSAATQSSVPSERPATSTGQGAVQSKGNSSPATTGTLQSNASTAQSAASAVESTRPAQIIVPKNGRSSLSIIGAVSPPGGDFFEPVTQSSLRVAKAFWALDARLSQKRHFPSVNWLEAYTLYRHVLAPWYTKNLSDDWTARVERIGAILQDEAQLLEIVQLVGSDSLPQSQQLTLQTARLIREGLLQQSSYDPLDTYCPIRKSYLLMRLMTLYDDLGHVAIVAGVSAKAISDLRIVEKIFQFKFSTTYDDDARTIEREMRDKITNLQLFSESRKSAAKASANQKLFASSEISATSPASTMSTTSTTSTAPTTSTTTIADQKVNR